MTVSDIALKEASLSSASQAVSSLIRAPCHLYDQEEEEGLQPDRVADDAFVCGYRTQHNFPAIFFNWTDDSSNNNTNRTSVILQCLQDTLLTTGPHLSLTRNQEGG